MFGVGPVRELVGLRAGRSLIDLIDAPAGEARAAGQCGSTIISRNQAFG